MCTVSWLPHPGGYVLFTSRDERKTRAPALPPEVRDRDGVRYMAPIDADAGGTWVLVNEHGLTVALLNRWGVPGDREPTNPRSRGLLVLDLASAPTLAEARVRLTAGLLRVTRPFSLVLVEPDRPAWLASWSGHLLEATTATRPGFLRSSSSVTEPEVLASRQALFAALDPVTAQGLEALHRSHLPERGHRSVCMHREEAETQAFTRIEVSAAQVTLAHAPGAPCETEFLPPLALARRPIPCPFPE